MRTRYITNPLHLESTTALYNPAVCRSPQFIPILILGLQSGLGFGAALSVAFSVYSGTLLSIGLSIGISLISSLFAPKPPKPEDVQSNIRQAIPFATKLYGRALLGGPWIFGGTHRGAFHKVIALHLGKLSAINNFYADDRIVVPNETTGVVPTDPFGNKLRLRYRIGLPTETYYDELEDAFPEWTSSHRGDGIATLYATQYSVKAKDFAKVFPNGKDTLYRADVNGLAVYDPSDEEQDIDAPDTWDWSDNLARCVMDFMWNTDGMRAPRSLLTTPLALDGWVQAKLDCDDLIDKKAGGTEARYRCWTPYTLNERPADVVRRMMAAGDATFKPTSDGGLTIEVGKWREPEITIDDDCIESFESVGRGKNALETANTINAQFTSPDHFFQATDADPWIDDADVSERGEIPTDITAVCAPSHGQARRLMKIAAHRANPAWVGSFVLNKRGIKAFGERFINLSYTPLAISGTFEVVDFKFLIGENSTVVGATISVQSMTAAAFDWNAETEEGTAPPTDDIDETGDSLPSVEGFTAALVVKTVSGVPLPYARLSWTAPEDGLSVELRGKKVGDTAWTAIGYSAGETTTDWLMTEEGATYEFEGRTVGLISEGDWADSTPSTLVAVSNSTPPLALTSFAITGSVALALGHAPLSFVTANDPNLNRIAIYRVPTGVTLDKTAHFAFRIYGVPLNASFSYVDGDNTRTNLWPDPGFTGVAGITYGAGWSRNAGTNQADHASAAAANMFYSVSPVSGTTYRTGFEITAQSAAGTGVQPRLGGGTAVNGTAVNGVGIKLQSLLANGTNTLFGFLASTWVGSLDNVYFYAQTSSCAPQGDWDYYAIPENASGIEGPQATKLDIVVV